MGRPDRSAALEQIDIEIPVAVGVEEPRTSAGDLGEREVAFVARVVDETDARFFGDLGESLRARETGAAKGEAERRDEVGSRAAAQSPVSIWRPAGWSRRNRVRRRVVRWDQGRAESSRGAPYS